MSWLDEVTPEQKAAVDELKKRTINVVPAKLLTDRTLFYRFSKARDFNVDDAEAMLRKHLTWRKEYQIDSIFDFKPPEAFLKYICVTFRCFDKTGCLVRYIDFGNMDLKGLLNSSKKGDVLKYLLYLQEEDIKIIEQRNKEFGTSTWAATYVYNNANLSFSNVTDRRILETALAFMNIFQDNYPERVKFMIHVNASIYFTMFFSAVKPLLAGALLQKIKVFGTEGWKEELLKLVDADIWPAFLGGKRTDPDGNPLCLTHMPLSQKVPESYYLKKSEKKMSRAPNVQKLTITRFSKDEISYEVDKPGSFLEWEFETKNRDIGFSVKFRERSTKKLKSVEIIPKQRLDSYYEPEKGMYKCEKAGTYTLVFDNSYSWFHPKEIYYRARIRSAEDVEKAEKEIHALLNE